MLSGLLPAWSTPTSTGSCDVPAAASITAGSSRRRPPSGTDDDPRPRGRRGRRATMRGRRRSGGRDTREAILASARGLFAERGYDRTTMRAVAGPRASTPALIHHDFGTKEGLLAESGLLVHPGRAVRRRGRDPARTGGAGPSGPRRGSARTYASAWWPCSAAGCPTSRTRPGARPFRPHRHPCVGRRTRRRRRAGGHTRLGRRSRAVPRPLRRGYRRRRRAPADNSSPRWV